MSPFDAGNVVLLACLVVVVCALGISAAVSRGGLIGAAVGTVMIAILARISLEPQGVTDVLAALLLIAAGLGLGYFLFARRRWPRHGLLVLLATVTAVGAYERTFRLDEVFAATERHLQPDVRYYQQQALRTANPFAAGEKSPLWPALNAPIVRASADPDRGMRWLSWACGILMLPAVGLALSVLLSGAVGVIVSGALAFEPWLIDLCTEGLREEAGVCLWMLVLWLALARPQLTMGRSVATGLAGGVLLLLRNISVLPLVALMILLLVQRRAALRHAPALLGLPFLLVLPFYVNQYRVHGDAFWMEKRDARYHANIEFSRESAPPGLTMPTHEEWRANLFAGEPLSPMAYLLKYHSFGDFLRGQWKGTTTIIRGRPFASIYTMWFRIMCMVGLIGAAAAARTRWMPLFVLACVAGIPAHLYALGHLEQRLLLPVLVIWLAAGTHLLVEAARRANAKIEA